MASHGMNAILTEIDQFETDLAAPACECPHCPPHQAGSGCHCDHPAAYAVRIHCLKPRCTANHNWLLCQLCFDAAKNWAVECSQQIDECPHCQKPIRCAEDLIGPVIPL